MLRWLPDRYGFKGSGHNSLSSLLRDPCHIPELHSRGNTIAVRIRSIMVMRARAVRALTPRHYPGWCLRASHPHTNDRV